MIADELRCKLVVLEVAVEVGLRSRLMSVRRPHILYAFPKSEYEKQINKKQNIHTNMLEVLSLWLAKNEKIAFQAPQRISRYRPIVSRLYS